MTTVAATATPINTFADILAALERNPDLADRMRQHILTQELQALPAAFATMQDDIVDIKALLARMMERQERTEADVVDIKALLAQVVARQDRAEADIADLKTGQARLEAGQAKLETDVADLKVGQARLETDVADLKVGQARLETDVADLKVGQARLETDFADLKEGQNQTNSRLGNITGTVYEQAVIRRFRSIARRHLGLRDAQVLHAVNHPYDPDLKAATDHAEEHDIITFSEVFALDKADIIASGRRRDGSSVCVVVEISETADDDDIDRAQERAAILQKATDRATFAAVIGKEMSATNRQRADRQEVTVVILDDK